MKLYRVTKFLSRFLFILLLPFVVSCEESNEKVYLVGFSNCFDDDLWRKSMVSKMKVEASLNPDIDLKVFESYTDAELQISNVNLMIENNYDLIIISPLDADLIVPSLEKAHQKNIPVILIDRKANTDKYQTFIGADNYDVGELAAEYILSSSNSETNIVELYVNPKTSVGYERSQGFNNTIKSRPEITIVERVLAADFDNHREVLRETYQNHPEIDFLFAFNDALAKEAFEIAQQVDKKNSIKFIGVDGLNLEGRGISLVKDKILSATILYPTGGQEAIRTSKKILEGVEVPRNITLNTILIDSLNADIMGNQMSKIESHVNDIELQQSKLADLQNTYSSQRNLIRLLVILLGLIIILSGYSIYSGFVLRKKKKELEVNNKKIRKQSKQIKKIADEIKINNESKINFFTGLSHEFKTPLTLILSSTESLSEKEAVRDGKLLDEIALIYKNSKRLLRMINQLLDFRKLEGETFTLKASKTDLIKFSEAILKDFENEAKRRNIKLNLTSNQLVFPVYIDRNLMDKVYFNLLSNAFKFTPNNGIISIHIEDLESNEVDIHFTDTGIGIPNEELENVFEIYYKGSNNTKNSSGLGLHLSKKFIEMHKGSISVKSKKGAHFTIKLKKGSEHFNPEQIIDQEGVILENPVNFYIENDDRYEINTTTADKDLLTILIVEDNIDLNKFLTNKLLLDYNVISSDGSNTIELALEKIPDLIICDVNLPDKSGFEICSILKNDLRTSHIPIIILTAQDNKESYIQGLESGADLFLTKPFSLSILRQSIKTLIFNREKLRYYFVNNIHAINDKTNFGSLEQEFIAEVNKLIEENIDNSDFSVEILAGLLNISRVQLYRKIKAIMNLNISDYILNIRLEKGKHLLIETQMTVSEIAYAVGFSTPNYFATSFKSKFNISPSLIREKGLDRL